MKVIYIGGATEGGEPKGCGGFRGKFNTFSGAKRLKSGFTAPKAPRKNSGHKDAKSDLGGGVNESGDLTKIIVRTIMDAKSDLGEV